jgi:uncharacterized membrane protein YfcA
MVPPDIALALGFMAAAALYASVGHAGASAYLAVMALAGMPQAQMRPTALVLNVVVATIGTVLYARQGCFSWRALWPFLIGSVPLAMLGGSMALPDRAFKLAIAGMLVVAAGRLAVQRAVPTVEPRPPPITLAVGVGMAIGLLAGLTGTGGGIFLTPVLLWGGWADSRRAAGVSSAFILANSLAGLAGGAPDLTGLSPALPLWIGAVVAGGTAGAWMGSRKLTGAAFRRLLAVVLCIAAGKMVLT